MGKGRIVSGGTDGSYTVELLHNRDRIESEIAFLTAKLAELQEELDALETEREGMVAERDWIATDIDTAIANTEEGEIPDVEALLVELAQVSAKIQAQDVRIAMIQGRMLEARKRKEMLDAIPADPQQQAWCADFTEDLTGEVATVEVPAEGVVGQFLTWRRAQIRPGFAGGASYSTARDGQMFHREGQVGYQAYFNAAILPGVQRWKPQYRIGVITAIDRDNDTCSLTIQGEDSSAQSLLIDPPDLQYAKTGVPIEYMDCNAWAFEVGDRVLIEFAGRSWDAPKVIGFEVEPRECLLEGIICTYQDSLWLLQYDEGWTARQAPNAEGRVGLDGYWRGTDGVVVSWGDDKVFRGRESFARAGIMGACIVGGILRTIRLDGLSLVVSWLFEDVFGNQSWNIDSTLALSSTQVGILPDALPFKHDGGIDIAVLFGSSSFRLTYSIGGDLELSAIPNATATVSSEWEISTLFESCGSPSITAGTLVDGSTQTNTTAGSTTQTINGYEFTRSISWTAIQTWPGPQTVAGFDRLSCAALTLADADIEGDGLWRTFTVRHDPQAPGAAVLIVFTDVAGDPGNADALSIAPPGVSRPATLPMYRVRTAYSIADGVRVAVATTKTYTGDLLFPAYGNMFVGKACSGRECDPQPCTDTETGSSSNTTPYPWFEILAFRTMTVPTEVGGRFLLTDPEIAGASILKGGNIGALVGEANHYQPASVIVWKD